MFEGGAQRHLERPELGFERAPLSTPSLRIGRRTCSALAVRTGRLVSWKRRHAGVEGQAAEIEQRADLRLGIVDQPLVDQAVDGARQHRIEMRHQPRRNRHNDGRCGET